MCGKSKDDRGENSGIDTMESGGRETENARIFCPPATDSPHLAGPENKKGRASDSAFFNI